MGKYSPLKDFLATQEQDYVPMTFAKIEEVLGIKLPASKRYPAWWSNNPSNNPMTREWLDAGYETESVNIGSEKLVFRRFSKNSAAPAGPAAQRGGKGGSASLRHPLFGCLKGTLTIPPGVDLTEPADPELAAYLDRKYGAEVGSPR
jgi:hypothetical protein